MTHHRAYSPAAAGITASAVRGLNPDRPLTEELFLLVSVLGPLWEAWTESALP